jgi:hypothetical protein
MRDLTSGSPSRGKTRDSPELIEAHLLAHPLSPLLTAVQREEEEKRLRKADVKE